MLRSVVQTLKSPVRTFPALAAAIGCLVSGYSTFHGISEIFPAFQYALLAAAGLAVIIQLGMLSATVTFREQAGLRPLLVFIVAFTVMMSSFTSYVFYYRGYSEETIAKGRQTDRWESLRRYLVDARGQTAGTLGTLREAEAELQTRIDMERGSGGGLHNISNPYLQRLVGESDLRLDIDRVASGSGERYRFLTTVLPRLQQMESEMTTALAALDGEIAILTGDEEVSQAALRTIYARASLAIPAERIREVQGSFTVQAVDPFILDTSPLEEEEYWQRAMADLFNGQASAIVFAFMALFVDLMVVFFAFVAGASQVAFAAPRLSLRHWFDLAYGKDAALGMRRWLESLSGERVVQGNAVLHEVEPQRLTGQRDERCARFLRQDGYLRRLRTADGRSIWCLHDEAYGALIKHVRRARPPSAPVATVAPQVLAVSETADV